MPISTGVTSFSGSATGLTPSTPRTGAVALAGTLAAASGGTGLTAVGASGNVLTSNGSTWVSSAETGLGTVTSVELSGGATGITTSGGPITTSGTITLAGTLAIANGGTGVTTSTGSGNNVLSASPTLTGTIAGASQTLSGTLGVTGVSTFAAGSAAAPSITTTGDTNTGVFFPAADTIAFSEGGAEAMRIDSSGRVLIAATATGAYFDANLNVDQPSASGVTMSTKQSGGTASQVSVVNWHTATTGDNQFIQFGTEASFTQRGSIVYNRAGGLTAYNTTSDYRAKTVNGLVENALAKVALLKPSTGRMNGASIDIEFFVAHELQEVIPSAVTGKKDAVNEDGSPAYQMVDKSAIIPLLTAAIQEQQALITALTAAIQELKADFDAYKAAHP